MLPAPVLNNPTSAMQKQLQKVKKEKYDNIETPSKSSKADIRETLSESTPAVAALLSAQSLLQPSSKAPTPSLDDILKKYNLSSK